MKILVINAGSSSLKYQLFNMEDESVIAKGNCERIGQETSFLIHKNSDGTKKEYHEVMEDHTDAIKLVFKALTDPETGNIKSMDEIGAVGHRVVNGGEKFSKPVLVDASVKATIKEMSPLSPLHNPANLAGINACQKIMPNIPQVAVFDTAFHQTMPKKAYLYAIPYEYYEKYQIRRYGFHGTSHCYISGCAAKYLGRENDPDLKVITCHLGNGSSFAAVKGGKCVDTSMGLTPLEGIPMGTRSGTIDPAIIGELMNRLGLNINKVMEILNTKSGVYGISGLSSDFRDLEDAEAEGNERAILAREMFAYSGSKLIASYAAAMGGVDAVVFTGGVGENDGDIRVKMCRDLGFMGIKIDPNKNNVRSKVAELSPDGAPVKVMLIPTNEELVIANSTQKIVEAL
jgi:acetate kinase